MTTTILASESPSPLLQRAAASLLALTDIIPAGDDHWTTHAAPLARHLAAEAIRRSLTINEALVLLNDSPAALYNKVTGFSDFSQKEQLALHQTALVMLADRLRFTTAAKHDEAHK